MQVPCYKQEFPWSCFAACMRMILEYCEVKKTERELRILLKTTPSYGTIWDIAEKEIRRIGFELKWKTYWKLEELVPFISQSTPIIAGVWLSEDADKHAVVILNMSENFVTFIDPEYGKLVNMDKTEFLNLWGRRKNIGGYIVRK